MLKTTKSTNLTGNSTVDGTQVVYMSATISTDINQSITVNKNITNQELYFANKVEVRKDISDFEDEVYAIEDAMREVV